MTTPQIIVTAFSGAACIGCAMSTAILIAEAYAKSASRRWWLNRDPLWVDPFPAGASAANAGSSAATSLARVGSSVSAASHPTATPPSVATVTTSRSPAGTLIRGLILSRSIR